jgi:hypothetical protein
VCFLPKLLIEVLSARETSRLWSSGLKLCSVVPVSIFQTPSHRIPALPRQDNVNKTEGVLQHLKSTCSSSSESGNGSHSGTLSTSNRTEEKKSQLALYEVISFKTVKVCGSVHLQSIK